MSAKWAACGCPGGWAGLQAHHHGVVRAHAAHGSGGPRLGCGQAQAARCGQAGGAVRGRHQLHAQRQLARPLRQRARQRGARLQALPARRRSLTRCGRPCMRRRPAHFET